MDPGSGWLPSSMKQPGLSFISKCVTFPSFE